jgi:eukaryotic-like serine/threonine-protein kinase
MSGIPDRLTAALADRYRIERELGQGGMATVYLAEDLKHDRKVALKVLKPELAAVIGGERFVVEIKTTAALSHPHILPLFDSGTVDGFLYYVMPYIEGETLRDKLNRETQLGIDEAVRITSEVADALDYAHRHGVIHRDIKPENILLHDGRPMVMDFGIALAVSAAAGGRMTETGLSLGTPYYMSPEQATADKEITARSDIYSLAVVLYEMLAGEPPHIGNSAQQIIMKIVTEDAAPVTRLRKTVPANVAAALAQALERLPADRFESAKAFADALENPAFATTTGGAFGATTGGSKSTRVWQYATVAVSLVAVGAVVYALPRPKPATRVVRFSIPGASSVVGSTTQPAVSPDGRAVAYSDQGGATAGIRVRWLDRDTSELLPGTDGAGDVTFSPDGKGIAYTILANELHTIGVDGRSPQLLTKDAVGHCGLSWARDGHLYFCRGLAGTAIARVPAAGGTVEVVATIPDSSVKATGAGALGRPLLLDDGRTLLAATSGVGSLANGSVVMFDLKTGTRTNVVAGLSPLAVRDGWLLYGTADGSIQAQRFDGHRVSGAAVPVQTGVYTADGTMAAAVGGDGTLFYQPATSALAQLTWVSRAGVETIVDSTIARPYIGMALSPDGDEIAAAVADASGTLSTIWLYDLKRRTFAPIGPAGDYSFRPAWMPDGRRLLFSSDHGSKTGLRRLFSIPVDGSDTLHLVLARVRHVQEVSWPAGGKDFAFREGYDDGGTRRDIFAAAKGDTIARPLLDTKADERNPAVAPDGRWLAYTSDASGRDEVYVTPFPNGGPRIQVSNAGGTSPVWARDGRQLYFLDGHSALVTTAIDEHAANPAGATHRLFDASQYYRDSQAEAFDVSPDGQRFLFIKAPPRASLDVVLDWWAETTARLAKIKH